MSAILQSIHDSFDYIVNLSKEKFIINESFDKDLGIYLNINKCKKISGENVIRAYNMLTYFNKHKLALAAYQFDISSPIKEVFTNLISSAASINEGSTVQQQVAGVLLLCNDSEVRLNDLNQRMSRKTSISLIENVCKDLQNNGFGKLIKCLNTNGPATKIFVKEKISNFTPLVITNLQELGVNLEEFKQINKDLKKGNSKTSFEKKINKILFRNIFKTRFNLEHLNPKVSLQNQKTW